MTDVCNFISTGPRLASDFLLQRGIVLTVALVLTQTMSDVLMERICTPGTRARTDLLEMVVQALLRLGVNPVCMRCSALVLIIISPTAIVMAVAHVLKRTAYQSIIF